MRHADHVAEGLAFLDKACPTMNRIIPLSGEIPLRLREPGFEGLAHIVVGQQVSVASANAIWGRTRTIFDPLTPERILAATDEEFIAAGLSRPKQRTLRAIAEAAASGALPLATLGERDADEVHATLIAVKGIGPWTADVFAMFCLGHANAFAAGDLALQEAARMAFNKRKRPDEKQLLKLAKPWAPWRSVAARVLWAYYKVQKSREGVTG
ncbi:DNA-3-methyladenine glycosylase family protein [Terrirubrum flagellatum]|uniref:DNA-3-methyladenine glycosylase family protein n=1 Tax=Terrirubrum flagellatum TaxID=2895980 RepID=UPI003CC81B39